MVDWKYLVSLDIGGIHGYIFGTDKLREIRGASVLLDKLNSKTAVAEITRDKYGLEDKDWKCIVTGGGNIKILFADKAKAEEYKASLSGKFGEMATGAQFNVIISEKGNQSEYEWIQKAERELQREKRLPKEKNQLATSSFFKACQACGLHPAEEEEGIHPEEIRYICKSCHQKVDESAKYREADIYKRLIEKVKLEPRFPSEFSEIGKKSEPQEGYIGFIYADANRMGERLAKIKTFDGLKKFSKDVEEATLDATVTAIMKHFKEEFLPVQIILAGGDDLILALPAHKAIDVAMDFCQEFNKGMTDGITTSASVVICHDTLPIRNILDAAESLLKKAKAESRERDGGSYVDFIVVTGSALEDPVSKRKRELEILDRGIHSITNRPYSLEEMRDLIKAIQELKKVNFPRNKLRMLYNSLFKGHYQSILDACYIKTRLEGRHENAMRDLKIQFRLTEMFPWEKIDIDQYTTPFGDIVELYEFIQLGKLA